VARYTGPVCRLCRREGMKLFLKGDRCFTEKCAIEKRNYAPGQHGKGARVKSKLQGYGLQLREKQKAKRLYRLMEGQFALTFDRATQEKGVSGELLLQKLERRLDNVVYRLGFGSSRDQARQLVRHGHVKVLQSVEAVKGRGVPKWLELDATAMQGRVLSMPARDDVNFPIQEQLIVELYSK